MVGGSWLPPDISAVLASGATDGGLSSSSPESGGENTVAGSGTERSSSPASALVSVPAHGVPLVGALLDEKSPERESPPEVDADPPEAESNPLEPEVDTDPREAESNPPEVGPEPPPKAEPSGEAASTPAPAEASASAETGAPAEAEGSAKAPVEAPAEAEGPAEASPAPRRSGIPN